MSKRKGGDQPLRQLSNEEKIESFKEYKVAHKRIVEVSEQVKSASQYLDRGCFIFLVGPPGIGKTTVMNGVYRDVIRSHIPRMQADLGFIPAIQVNTKAEDGRFDWKEHWKDCLRALREPLIDYKILPKRRLGGDDGQEIMAPDGNGSKTLYRNAFESAARNRKLIICFKDEAHHFTHVSAARLIRQQHEILKSAASRSESIFALFGSYDLLALLNLSGQLGRRTRVVHFERYRPNVKEDVYAFANAAKTLLDHMPLRRTPTFSNDDLMICCDMSLGCVGLLKDILVATLYSVLKANEESLSIKDVMQHELTTDTLDRASKEIIKGEKKLKESESERQLKRQIIKLRMEGGEAYAKENLDHGESSNLIEKSLAEELKQKQHASKKQPKKKSRRIERSPKRDPVGEGRKKKAA